jgi:sporulation protein YlmC with PRC-barrel domain
MLRMKKLSEVASLQVFTETGEHFGEIEEAILAKNKVESWKIRATRDSFLSKALSGAKGVVVPHLMVKALGDIMIVSKNAAPSYSEEEEQAKQ